MTDYIVNTSPFQYLYQVGRLEILSRLSGRILAPTAVAAEVAAGRTLGIDLPDLDQLPWVTVASPARGVQLPFPHGLGAGEIEVLTVALERGDAVAILDDRRARQAAQSLDLRVTGTLGLILDAKKSGLISAVRPVLDDLQARRFRVSSVTRQALLRLAGESS